MAKELPELSTYRIGELESDVRGLKDTAGSLEKTVNRILTNHLPHLAADIAKVDKKVELLGVRVSMGIAVNVLQAIALIIGLVLIFKK